MVLSIYRRFSESTNFCSKERWLRPVAMMLGHVNPCYFIATRGNHSRCLFFNQVSPMQTWGQFHFSNSTQFHLVNSNSTSNLSIPIQNTSRSIPIQFRLYIYIGGKCSYIHVLYGEVPWFSPPPPPF